MGEQGPRAPAAPGALGHAKMPLPGKAAGKQKPLKQKKADQQEVDEVDAEFKKRKREQEAKERKMAADLKKK